MVISVSRITTGPFSFRHSGGFQPFVAAGDPPAGPGGVPSYPKDGLITVNAQRAALDLYAPVPKPASRTPAFFSLEDYLKNIFPEDSWYMVAYDKVETLCVYKNKNTNLKIIVTARASELKNERARQFLISDFMRSIRKIEATPDGKAMLKEIALDKTPLVVSMSRNIADDTKKSLGSVYPAQEETGKFCRNFDQINYYSLSAGLLPNDQVLAPWQIFSYWLAERYQASLARNDYLKAQRRKNPHTIFGDQFSLSRDYMFDAAKNKWQGLDFLNYDLSIAPNGYPDSSDKSLDLSDRINRESGLSADQSIRNWEGEISVVRVSDPINPKIVDPDQHEFEYRPQYTVA